MFSIFRCPVCLLTAACAAPSPAFPTRRPHCLSAHCLFLSITPFGGWSVPCSLQASLSILNSRQALPPLSPYWSGGWACNPLRFPSLPLLSASAWNCPSSLLAKLHPQLTPALHSTPWACSPDRALGSHPPSGLLSPRVFPALGGGPPPHRVMFPAFL